MEPWDGPAGVAFTNGKQLGALLDRNGLRPARYYLTHDDLLVMGSEAGAIELPPEEIKQKWRLQPGKMLLADFEEGRIIDDAEVKGDLLDARPWGRWIRENMVDVDAQISEERSRSPKLAPGAEGWSSPVGPRVDLSPEPVRDFDGLSTEIMPSSSAPADDAGDRALLTTQRAFGYTNEDLRMLIYPMAAAGAEAVGSMGADTPLACLSDRPQPLFNYFKQLFAQVTNPPLDAIREEMVTSLVTYLGHERNLLDEKPDHARLLKLRGPVLLSEELAWIKEFGESKEGTEDFSSATIPFLFDRPADDATDEDIAAAWSLRSTSCATRSARRFTTARTSSS